MKNCHIQPVDTGVRHGFQFEAFCGGRPAGVIKVYRSRKRIRNKTVWVVARVFVEPRFRRERIATQLYEHAAKEACRRRGRLASTERDWGAFSIDFWEKQVRKGRAERIARVRQYRNTREGQGPDMYDAFILDCAHAGDLSGFRAPR